MGIENFKSSEKILIVDDNPKNLQVLGGTLQAKNYLVEFSTDGEGALNWLKEETFDLILLDIMMPDMDGYETCKQLRAFPEYNDIPVIFLTAKTDKDSLLKGFKVGAQDYITKPFDPEELMARVSMHLELRQARLIIKDVNALLEEKVIERTKQLNEANKELSGLDNLKGEFLKMLSHEIRTPLNGIKGSLQLLKVRIENESLVKLINILDSSVERLEKFSYTALLITRLKSGKFKPYYERLKVNEEIEFCLLPIEDEIKTKNLLINNSAINKDIEVSFDKELFNELLKRVIDNAVKYSPDNSQVEIKVEDQDDYTDIKIIDEGNGFPDWILNNNLKLFNPGEDHVNKNMGLNLYLANLIINNLDGKMRIYNGENFGAVVELKFKKTDNINQ